MVARPAQMVSDFLKGEEGPTASEYAIMLALIVLVCVTAFATVGRQASTSANQVANQLGDSVASFLALSNSDALPPGTANKDGRGNSRQVANDPAGQPPATDRPEQPGALGTGN